MLDLRQLRVLAAVADSGSMTQAATRLSYTPSAVSQQMAALERQLGTPLLVRHARGVRLTDAGRLLVERAALIDDQLRHLEDDVDDLVNLRGGRLRLGAFASAGARLIPEAIARFRSRYPKITMTLDILDPGAALEAVTAARIDLAVIFDYPGGPEIDTGAADAHRLADDEVFIAVCGEHRLADAAAVGMAGLRSEPWIKDCGPDPMCRELLDRLSAQVGYQPTIAFESDNYLAIGRLVAAGVGIALVPGLAAEQMPAEIVLRPLDPTVTRRITAVPAAGTGPATAEMITILAGLAAKITGYRATPAVRRSV